MKQLKIAFYIVVASCLMGAPQFCEGQTDWKALPWQHIGDSSKGFTENPVMVTGTVKAKLGGEPLQGASISFDTFKFFDYADDKGRYLVELTPGEYKVSVRFVGMQQQFYRIKIYSGGAFNFEMEEGANELDEVIITSRAIDSNVKSPIAGATTLSIAEVKTLPTLMGEIDIVKSLQLTPGVSSVGEGSSGFNVRGGRVDQNLISINDMPVFNVSHALGFISGLNQDVIDNFTLYKGNVPSNYGGRASSVLDIKTRKGETEEWEFQGGVGGISSRFTAEGPVGDKTSVLMAGRVSYSNWMLGLVDDPNVRQSAVSFYDLFGSVNHRLSENSNIEMVLYNSSDRFQFSEQFGYQWNNSMVTAKWRSLADKKASPVLSLGYGRYKSTLFDPSGIDASQLTNTLNYFQLKETVNYIPTENHNIVFGFEGMAYIPENEELSTYNNNPAIVPESVSKKRGLEYSLFVNDDFKLSEKFSFSLGLRFSNYTHMGPDTVYQYAAGQPKTINSIQDTLFYSSGKAITSYRGLEPRVSLRYSITENQSIKFSYNRMRQYIHLISNTAAPTPVDIWQVSNEYIPPQIADNFSVGYFLNLKENRWETSAEVFYKKMDNLVEYKDFAELFLNNHIETELLSGKGKAYGLELFIRKIRGRWTGWIAYTYSQTLIQVDSPYGTESINNGEWFPSNYNKPHSFNLVANRRTFRGGAWSFILTYNTGRPLTAVESSYITDGTVVPVYSDRNEYKIPDYIRLDFSFTIPSVIKKLDDNLVFSIYNLLGRANAYSVFYQRPGSNFFVPKSYKLSILGSALPSLTYNFKF